MIVAQIEVVAEMVVSQMEVSQMVFAEMVDVVEMVVAPVEVFGAEWVFATWASLPPVVQHLVGENIEILSQYAAEHVAHTVIDIATARIVSGHFAISAQTLAASGTDIATISVAVVAESEPDAWLLVVFQAAFAQHWAAKVKIVLE